MFGCRVGAGRAVYSKSIQACALRTEVVLNNLPEPQDVQEL